MLQCPQQHQSETADFCSVCGAEMSPAAPAPVPMPSSEPAVPGDPCPECGAARESSGQVFCEVCGFNFKTGQPGATPPPPPVAAAVQPPVEPVATAAPATAPVRWDVTVRVDANLYGTPNPDAPVNNPEQRFSLFETENLLGRATTGVRVQIPVAGDHGVSRRHAMLTKTAGGLTVRDLGSANGTQLNGVELVGGVDAPIKDGDTLAVGAWTKITIHAVPS
jgi:hypothetical protein